MSKDLRDYIYGVLENNAEADDIENRLFKLVIGAIQESVLEGHRHAGWVEGYNEGKKRGYEDGLEDGIKEWQCMTGLQRKDPLE